MKYAVSVSLLALAVAGCATTAPPADFAAVDPTPAAPVAAGEAVLTPEAARAFVAAA